MFAGGAPPPRASPPRAPPRAPAPPPPPRAGGGPSGTTTALVIVVSASLRLARFSHGIAAAAAAPRSTKTMLPIMWPPRAMVETIALKGPHAITQVELDPLGKVRHFGGTCCVRVVELKQIVSSRIEHSQV